MVKIIKGDILKQDTEALVNTVNCVGVMGRGIALSFRDAYPENYRLYKKAAEHGEIKTGKMSIFEAGDIFEKRYIINFPTKNHWRQKSKIEYITSGLKDLVRVIRELEVKSIAIPPLGCGLGGLDWNKVKPLIVNALNELPDVKTVLIEPDPSFNINRTMQVRKNNEKLTIGRAGMLALMGRYLEAQMDFGVSLLELHKLTYFLQECGEPLRLQFKKGPYGPYAENLPHVLDVMNNTYIKGFDNRENSPDKVIDIMDDAYGKAIDFLKDNAVTMDRIEKVADLISGFETPFGLELLSTVHWVSKNENAKTIDKAITMTHEWNSRKKMFDNHHITVAWNQLHEKICS